MNSKKPKVLTPEVLGRNTRKVSDAELEAVTGGRVMSTVFAVGKFAVVIAANEESYTVTTITTK